MRELIRAGRLCAMRRDEFERMRGVGAVRSRRSRGGTSAGRLRRWQGVAVAGVAATLFACAAPPPRAAGGAALRFERAIEAGLQLYEAREYAIAADRFREASIEARALRDRASEKDALTASCTSWLLAQRMQEFAECSDSLTQLHHKARKPDPGLGTLLAMGAIAGDRPAPPFRIPHEVAGLLRAAADEEIE